MNNDDFILKLEAQRDLFRKQADMIDDIIKSFKELPSMNTLDSFNKIFYAPNFAHSKKNDIDIIRYKDISYKKSDNLRLKIMLIVKAENRFLHLREIQEILLSNESNLNVKSISPALSALKIDKNKNFTSIKVGSSNKSVFWGYKYWIDKESIKAGHEFNSKLLTLGIINELLYEDTETYAP